MKVSVIVCLAVQVLVSAVTVPPSWIKYQTPKVPTQLPTLQITRNFYPKDTKPLESIQLQYRIPQHQTHILHPQNNQQHAPQSYQIVHFDNQKDTPVIQKHKKVIHNNNQHLTEINPPVIKISSLPYLRFSNLQQNNHQSFPQKQLLIPDNEQNLRTNQSHLEITNKPKLAKQPSRNNENIKQQNNEQNLRNNQSHLVITNTNKPKRAKQPSKNNENISEPQYSANNQNERRYKQVEIPRNEEISDGSSENHELSEQEVPTRPIYPGEGQWAKYGLKHRPYIRPEQQYNEEETPEPEGYETFEKGQQQFQNAQSNHQHDIDSLPSKIPNDENENTSLYKNSELGYVPEKLYAQVRRTESVQILPRSSLDPEQEEAADRLREVVKDSRIHTVYTEEGYEDTAYDHAGHEKQAENHEGYGEKQTDEQGIKGRSNGQNKEQYNDQRGRKRGGNHQRRKIQRTDKNKNEEYEHKEKYNKHKEEETAASSLQPQITTITVKNNNNQSVNMEIHTEIKVTTQKKKHKFVKIIPSVAKENETLKRVKRYDKEKLSQKYVRKRPSYYWKKTRTTSTERTVPQNRKNFEAAFKTHRPKLDEDYLEDLGINAPKNIPETTPKTVKPVKKVTKNFEAAFKTHRPKVDEDYFEDLENKEPKDVPESTTKSTVTPKKKVIKKIVVKTSTTSTTSTTTVSTTTSTNTEMSNTTESNTTIHPDLMNPELTTKAAKPATPKPPPVKIRKFKVKRVKRFTNDFPKIQVDLKEFTDVNKIKLSPPTPDLTHLKYPYYTLPKSHLHEDSPLRYAEDMKNIPEKTENLSFYKSREHIQCPEIPNHVNPIPERVENQEESDTEEETRSEPDLPRLKGLGDKIDCMKIKYFGENPLDSPFFKEDIIEQPVPFFEIKKLNQNSPDYLIIKDKNNKKRELKIKILEPIVVLEDDFSESATMNPIHSKSEAVLKPPYTLQEMMSMQEKLTPKSIYDQISILEADENTKKDSSQPKDFIIVYDNQATVDNNDTVVDNKETVETTTQTIKPYTIKPQIRKRPMMTMTIKKLPVKKIKKPQPRTTTTSTTTTTEAPTTKPYIPPTLKPIKRLPPTPKPLRQLISQTVPNPIAPKIPPKPRPINPININRPNPHWHSANRQIAAFYNIFDISKFLPRVPDAKLINDNYRNFMRPLQPIQTYSHTLQNENTEQSDSKTVSVEINTPEPKPETKSAETIAIMNQQDQMSEPNQPMKYVYIFGMNSPEIQHRIVKRSNLNEDLLMEETENKASYIRPQYTEIRRARPTRPKESEEEEDLNPRKRVYELQSSRRTTTESPVVEEIEEIVEEIEDISTTTAEPKIYPVEANKQDPNIAQYIFFIEKLHNKWAKEDASTTTTTTEKPTEKTTENQQVVAASVNVNRGEPAYLQIINQLHEIRKEEDEKTTTTTTTTTEETEVVPQKNSNPFLPDFMSELNNMRTTLDSDAESSNVETTRNRNYSNRFRTNIDTTKYKTIERAPVQLRHNFSSRFNSENQELPLQKDKTTQEPIVRPQSTTPITKDTTMDGSTVQRSTTPEESTTTVRTRTRGRFRGRSTTSTTERPTSSTTSTIHRRRRPIGSTTAPSTTSKPAEQIARRRRPLQRIQISTEKPKNHKDQYPEVTTPETVEDLVVVTPSNNKEEQKKQRRFQKVQERHIMSEVTLTRFYEPDSSEEDLEETKKHQYEVIGPLKNTDSLHGGNYKHENEKKAVNSSETYYTDTSLAENVNNLTELEKNNKEDLKEAQTLHSKIGLYPNMARMVNLLADGNKKDVSSSEEETEQPVFIKDPSRRMYYYARL